jgi:hypothetical protein
MNKSEKPQGDLPRPDHSVCLTPPLRSLFRRSYGDQPFACGFRQTEVTAAPDTHFRLGRMCLTTNRWLVGIDSIGLLGTEAVRINLDHVERAIGSPRSACSKAICPPAQKLVDDIAKWGLADQVKVGNRFGASMPRLGISARMAPLDLGRCGPQRDFDLARTPPESLVAEAGLALTRLTRLPCPRNTVTCSICQRFVQHAALVS